MVRQATAVAGSRVTFKPSLCKRFTKYRVVASEFVVALTALQDVKGDDQDGMSDRYHRSFRSPPSGQASELGGEVTMLLAGDGPSGLGQGASQPLVAIAGLARLSFSRAFMVSWTQSRPG